MLDWEGNMRPKKDREQRVVLDELPDDDTMVSSLHVGAVEQHLIDQRLHPDDGDPTPYSDSLYDRLCDQQELSVFKQSIGSTDVTKSAYVQTVDDKTVATEPSTDDSSVGSDIGRDDMEWLYADGNLDEYMAAAASGGVPRGIDAKHLAKVWRISHKEAERTLEVTSQHSTLG